jgi:DNA-binding response OmpR family regulator
MQLLVVEADATMATRLQQLLAQGLPDSVVQCVATLQAALDILHTQVDPSITCIILDLELPDLEVIATLIQVIQQTITPVIWLTSSSSPELRGQILQLGVSYVSKAEGLTAASLAQAVTNQIQIAIKRRRLMEGGWQLSPLMPPPSLLEVGGNTPSQVLPLAQRMQNLHLLVVEDDPGTARLIQHHIQRGMPEWTVTHVTTLRDALAYLRHQQDLPVACVVLDLGLPDSSGLATLIEMLHLTTAPVLVITSSAEESVRRQVLHLGAGYLNKAEPLTPATLLRAIREQIQVEHERRLLVESVQRMRAQMPREEPWPAVGRSISQVAVGLEDLQGQSRQMSGLVGVLWASVQNLTGACRRARGRRPPCTNRWPCSNSASRRSRKS